MRPVGVLAVLAIVGGLDPDRRASGTPLDDWLEPGRRAPGRADRAAGLLDERDRGRASALAGIGVAWWIYAAHAARAPQAGLLQRAARAQVLLRRGVRLALLPAGGRGSRARSTRFVERPLIARLDRRPSPAARAAPAAEVAQIQTGLVRTYALALAAGVAVLVLVFIVGAMRRWAG